MLLDLGSSGTRLYKLILGRLTKLEPWSALGMNISQRTWPKKLKKKKAASRKLQAASLTVSPRDDRISYYERNNS